MDRRIRAVVAALSTLMVAAAGVPSGAAACDPLADASVVARGVSAAGVRWQLRAGRDGQMLLAGMEFAPPFEEWGGEMGGPLPGHGRRLLLVSSSQELGHDRTESEVHGITSANAARVVVTLSDGRRVVVRTRRPPAAAVRRHPVLRRVRYFVRFLRSSAHPIRYVSYTADGHRVASWPPAKAAVSRVAIPDCAS